jgi:hypothetical protein
MVVPTLFNCHAEFVVVERSIRGWDGKSLPLGEGGIYEVNDG